MNNKKRTYYGFDAHGDVEDLFQPGSNLTGPLSIAFSDTHGDGPVRIRARVDPSHPLVCRMRRLNGAVLRMRPEKPRSCVTVDVA
jgi:hypothetical protein